MTHGEVVHICSMSFQHFDGLESIHILNLLRHSEPIREKAEGHSHKLSATCGVVPSLEFCAAFGQVSSGKLEIHGGIYDLKSGRVESLG